MNKAIEFWLSRWEEGQIGFHKSQVNPDLEDFWQRFALPEGSRVLIPLCGKSLDMPWFAKQGMKVTGIELSPIAIEQFAQEQQLTFKIEEKNNALCYSADHLEIWCHDIFTLNPKAIDPVDAIYDRAALIALPEKLRQDYVKTCLQWLKPKGKILLKTMAYDETQMQGPPYSIPHEEVMSLYQTFQSKTLLRHNERLIDESEHFYERGLRSASDSLWLIE